jgi:hypothetical protein
MYKVCTVYTVHCTLHIVLYTVVHVSMSVLSLLQYSKRLHLVALNIYRAGICKCLRSPGIDSQHGGPVRQPYLTHRPARLHRLAESIPQNRFLGSLNVYKFGLSTSSCVYFVERRRRTVVPPLPPPPAHCAQVVRVGGGEGGDQEPVSPGLVSGSGQAVPLSSYHKFPLPPSLFPHFSPQCDGRRKASNRDVLTLVNTVQYVE